ncbi:MAG: hypothetical protein K6D02_08720 [Lachnospiraceae bacterium]|nr:hypothetical protein [Lachnospiraceae bacterium]
MVNEEKVKIMTKLAHYEQVELKDAIKVNSQSSFEYVAFNTLKNVIGYSIAYLVVWFCISYFYTGYLLQDRFLEQYDIVINLVIVPLFVLIGITVFLSIFYYKNKYNDLREKTSEYVETLEQLQEFYDKTNSNEKEEKEGEKR